MNRGIILLAIILLMPQIAIAQGDVCAYLFYGSGCPHCANAISYIDGNHPEIELHQINIATEYDLIMGLYDKYGVPDSERGMVPILFIGDHYVMGDTPIIENIGTYIQECEVVGCACPSTDGVIEEEVSIYQMLGLAAVDAVNPCELAVLVILMTAILTKFPKEKGKALRAGLSFSLAVFLMYFVFGILIISGFKFLAGFTQLSDLWFYKLLGAFAIVLGLLNIKDAIKYGGGGFVMEVPMGWRPRMKKIISGTTSVKGAFVVGLIVSFFLTPCTAGPYFVAGGILSSISIIAAIPYLLAYMLVFISPMVAITLIVYFGFMTVENIGGWREKNIKLLHWIAGLILLGLGIAMLLGII